MICPWTTFILFFCFVACLIGTFDQNCDRYCQCQNGKCDHVTRNCTCNLGWTGATCNNFSEFEIKLTFAFLIYLCTSSSVINIENTVCGDHTNIYFFLSGYNANIYSKIANQNLGQLWFLFVHDVVPTLEYDVGPTSFCSSAQRNHQRLGQFCFSLKVTLEYFIFTIIRHWNHVAAKWWLVM